MSRGHGKGGTDAAGAGAAAPRRRTMLRWTGTAGMLGVAAWVTSCAPPTPPEGTDANGLLLRPGFTSRIIAKAQGDVTGTSFPYRIFPDGAATFADAAVAGGWYLVVNHEAGGADGGVSSIRFAPDGTVTDAFSICAGTTTNCAGGATPWGTWLTCEEVDRGLVVECDPTGAAPQQARPAMGAFAHEAAAVAADGRVYLTEDRSDGGFYRFTPTVPGDLSAGLLEVATGPSATGPVGWTRVPDPSASTTLCRFQVPGMIRFNGGEGIATQGTTVWFTTKGDNRVWAYDTASSTMALRYQAGRPSTLSGVDNLWLDAPTGNLLVAEDGDDMEVVVLRPDDTAEGVVRVPGQDISEITGPCFSPDRTRLYFSSQRGPAGPLGLPLGITYEVSGPWPELLAGSAT
jgi:hypothetical protein